MKKDEYLAIIEKAGFADIRIVKEKPIHVPDEILLQFLNQDELISYRASDNAILSVTVYGEKKECCAPGCCGPP